MRIAVETGAAHSKGKNCWAAQAPRLASLLSLECGRSFKSGRQHQLYYTGWTLANMQHTVVNVKCFHHSVIVWMRIYAKSESKNKQVVT